MMLARSFPKLERVAVDGVTRSIMDRQYVTEYGTRIIPGTVTPPNLEGEVRNRPTVFAVRKSVACKTIDAQFYGRLAYGVLISERTGAIVTDRQDAWVGKTYRFIMCTATGGPLPEEADELYHASRDISLDADLELRLIARNNYGVHVMIGRVASHHSPRSRHPKPDKVYGLSDDPNTGIPVIVLGELKGKQVSVRTLQRKHLLPPSRSHAGAAAASDNTMRLQPPPTGADSNHKTLIDSDVLLSLGVYQGCASEDERYAVKKRENCGLYTAHRFFEPRRGALKSPARAPWGAGPSSELW